MTTGVVVICSLTKPETIAAVGVQWNPAGTGQKPVAIIHAYKRVESIYK
jgi:hypothetical protein